ncbi:MAG: hypothetical protein ABI995_08495 [Acidobacteriota bacterium]
MPTALVTGASRGVGRGVAIGLHMSGFASPATIPTTKIRKQLNSSWGGYKRMNEDSKFTWALPFWASCHR